MHDSLFLSYCYTREKELGLLDELEIELLEVMDHLPFPRTRLFCSFWMDPFFDSQGYTTAEQIYQHCEGQVQHYDVFFSFVRNELESTGMERERRIATGLRKPFVLAIQSDLDFEDYRRAADYVIEFDTLDETFYKRLGLKGDVPWENLRPRR